MHQDIISLYQKRVDSFKEKAGGLERKANLYSTLRLVLFLLLAFSVFLIIKINLWFFAVAIVTIGTFLWCVKTHEEVKEELMLASQLIMINEMELRALNHDFNGFYSGTEFRQIDKPYIIDLDIFGNGSIYQMMNRASTISGKKKLAHWFAKPELNSEAIIRKQSRVKELQDLIDWRQTFQAVGSFISESENEQQHFIAWLSERVVLKQQSLLRFAGWVLPVISILMLAGGFVSMIPWSFILVYFTILFMLNRPLDKTIDRIFPHLERQSQILQKKSMLIKTIEDMEFGNPEIAELQSTLKNDGASKHIKKLAVISNDLGNRKNIIAVLVNTVFLRNLHNALDLEQWKITHQSSVPAWFEIISEFDALSGLACFAFNHPDYTYPATANKAFTIESKEMGHPLIKPDEMVCNDFTLKKGTLIILTGANMAGKSTFLRTVGVNLLLAMLGTKVCARNFSFQPADIFSSMVNKDSLNDHRSYFKSELNRLQMLVNNLNDGANLLLLLDEVLKGTNSKEQHEGSVLLIEKLISLSATGIIATHDLELAKLSTQFPSKLFTRYFEVYLKDDDFHFDYKMREGINRNMIAIQLMKKMGIS